MDCMFEAYLTHETVNFEPDDIPQTNDPVWILGREYNATQQLDLIRRDILSKLWFTYRKGFVPIGGDGFTSDKGWGCMLRCGQMVLAQALTELHLSRDWFWTPETQDSTYLKILSKFEDRRQAPFSIHQIAQMGKSEGKEIGQWFGPNTVAQVLKKLVKYDEWSSLEIHVALDNTIIIEDIRQLCILPNCQWKPLLLFIPLRLGLAEMNSIYVDGLKKCFQFEQSLGIIGGKPNSALYFIGYVGNEVIYLDPHTTQKFGFVENKETDDQRELDSTYHCKFANRISISSIDPSIAVAFFCQTESEFDSLCKRIETDLILPEKQPLFELAIKRPQLWLGAEIYNHPSSSNEKSILQTGSRQAEDDKSKVDDELEFDDSDNDFEIL